MKNTNTNTYYIKSELTGQVYKVNFIPAFSGWAETSEAEYLAWCKANNMEP